MADGRVALQIDVVPVPGARRVRVGRWHDPQRPDVRKPVAGRRSHRTHVTEGSIRNEGRDPLVKAQCAAGLTPQADVRVPAAGDQQQIGFDRPAGTTTIRRPDGDRGEPAVGATTASDDRLAAASVDDGDELDAGLGERGRDDVGRIVGREDDRAITGPDTVPPDVRRGRRGEHDARPVVIREDDRPFDGAGRQHDGTSPDVPQPALGGRGRPALGDRDVPVVVDAQGGRPGEEPEIRQPGKLLGLVDGRSLVDQDDPVAGPRGFGGSGPAGRPATDHERLAVGMRSVEPATVRGRGQAAHPGQAPGIEPVGQLDLRRSEHRLLGHGRPHRHDRVRLLGTGGHHATRTPVVDARRDPAHAVRQ